ncbi:MAG: hypothetical protein A3K19_07960 [Lentisphaerae bacterium RIFOXYB12_FULL_65_16]|nr:MAG: hypothetical protein A3K18_08870 [Lentisphaerae bacterium RIFOXYA12_64_32]OGV87583.1 MAG: hypothetical protein A3K19_07960 [Lentisphaerae bacterium RIFOXYB12_FULL_65_16]
MQSVTIREAQHNLAAFLRQVEAGEEIVIRRRNRPVARLVAIGPEVPAKVDWSGVAERRRELWGGKNVPGKPMHEIVSESRGDR